MIWGRTHEDPSTRRIFEIESSIVAPHLQKLTQDIEKLVLLSIPTMDQENRNEDTGNAFIQDLRHAQLQQALKLADRKLWRKRMVIWRNIEIPINLQSDLSQTKGYAIRWRWYL